MHFGSGTPILHVEGATPRAVETVVNHLQAVTGATERVTIQIDTTLQLLEFQSKVSKLLHKNIARSNPQPLFIAGVDGIPVEYIEILLEELDSIVTLLLGGRRGDGGGGCVFVVVSGRGYIKSLNLREKYLPLLSSNVHFQDPAIRLAKIASEFLKNQTEKDSKPKSGLDGFVGQSHVTDRLATFVQRERYHRRLNKGPAVFVFAGPPGVGKTYVAGVIASMLERPLVQYDMAQYKHAEDIDSFISPRPGLVGEGHLLKRLKENARSVVLFDEIEKAHPAMVNEFLLGVLGSGSVRDKKTGESVDVTEAIFILTSNCFQDLIRKRYQEYAVERHEKNLQALHGELIEQVVALSDPQLSRTLLSSLGKRYPYRCGRGDGLHPNPMASREFSDRIGDSLLLFFPHSKQDLIEIAILELERQSMNLKHSHNFGLIWTPKVPDFFAVTAMNSRGLGMPSSRTLHRTVHKAVDKLFFSLLDRVIHLPGPYQVLLYTNGSALQAALYSPTDEKITFPSSLPNPSGPLRHGSGHGFGKDGCQGDDNVCFVNLDEKPQYTWIGDQWGLGENYESFVQNVKAKVEDTMEEVDEIFERAFAINYLWWIVPALLICGILAMLLYTLATSKVLLLIIFLFVLLLIPAVISLVMIFPRLAGLIAKIPGLIFPLWVMVFVIEVYRYCLGGRRKPRKHALK
ncbi:hypothetical protein AAMO2058_000979000 [Amorphochlora amoebiformis]